uniref:Methylosome subunit pICln n=1 Tax=Heterorhabditis bacteriophora TaxID=37862 RepID=A0A1I7XUG4_HETBA
MIVLCEVSEPTEGVRLAQPQVQAYLDNQCMGEGMLCIAEREVTWISRSTQKGFTLTYPSIILHAVSTDVSTFPQECIYVLIDASKTGQRRRSEIPLYTAMEERHFRDLNLAEDELNNDDIDDDDDEPKSVAVRFVPADNSVLSQIYTEMCACQELNPDEDDDFSDDDNDEEMGGGDGLLHDSRWFTSENINNMEGFEMSEEGIANLQRMMGSQGNGHPEPGIVILTSFIKISKRYKIYCVKLDYILDDNHGDMDDE